ncbi:MAG: hypothetical protein QOD75_2501 [Blastocatellia bacterium]|nr:hypothetical protein [Blastocatellia bacterium]
MSVAALAGSYPRFPAQKPDRKGGLSLGYGSPPSRSGSAPLRLFVLDREEPSFGGEWDKLAKRFICQGKYFSRRRYRRQRECSLCAESDIAYRRLEYEL